MPGIARTRSDVNLRIAPKAGAAILDRLPADCPLEILEDQNRWYKVSPVRFLHAVSGYLPQEAMVFPVESNVPVFPDLPSGSGIVSHSSVPASVKVSKFISWLTVGGKPDWILDKSWSGLNHIQQSDLEEKIRVASSGVQPRWDDWVRRLETGSRLEDAAMNEWIAIMEGGRDVYAIRDYYIFMVPVQGSECLGWALKGQILRWTGNVACNVRNGKRINFYEVDFYRLSRYMHGWFRADISADYTYPTPALDPSIESNAKTVFDLSKSLFRLPQDEAIADAKKKGYTASQYIDVFGATNHHLVHFSLCGEFCVAALSGQDILPLLKSWLASKFWRAPAILKDPHEGTSVNDLHSLLDVVGLKGEIYSSIPTSPQLIKDKLDSGQFAIVGCGINSAGIIKANGRIRHWVVLEDVIPCDNSGWVRVYNPFYNREEVYNYALFMTSAGVGGGIWITPKSA